MRDDVAQTNAQSTAIAVHGLNHTNVVTDAATGTAVLFRYVRQDQAQFARLEPGGTVGVVLFAPLQLVGFHVFLGEAHDHVVERFQVFGHPGRAVVFQHCKYLGF
ncbi:hypothetical protein D3C71_1855420 [compost metagenome]